MSYTVKVNMIADQEIETWDEAGENSRLVNIHDIKTITVNSEGIIIGVSLLKDEEK